MALLTNSAISKHYRSVDVDKSLAVHISIAMSTQAEILPISCMRIVTKTTQINKVRGKRGF